jgi:hypothetical protein
MRPEQNFYRRFPSAGDKSMTYGQIEVVYRKVGIFGHEQDASPAEITVHFDVHLYATILSTNLI